MEFDEVTVKDNPGLCRCCLSEGCYKDLTTVYLWMNESEIYADMLFECFDISISQHMDGPNGPNRLICEVCITRLRDACNFKKQVLDSEKKFIEMLARGDFARKVVVYQDDLKAEMQEMVPDPDTANVEYLEDNVDYSNDDLMNPDEPTTSVSEGVTATPLAVKAKRGRPRKKPEDKVEKKIKTKTEQKLKKSRAVVKDVSLKVKSDTHESLERLGRIRRNIIEVLRNSSALPFAWNTRGFKCFYCDKYMKDCDTLKTHNKIKHEHVDLETFIPKRVISKDIPIKIDVSELHCNACSGILRSLEELISHMTSVHNVEYYSSEEVCMLPFVLNRSVFECVLCDSKYDNFTCMTAHMYKNHVTHSVVCQVCGVSFVDAIRLKRHISGHNGHKCRICGKVFNASHKLDKHKQRIHGQTRVYECTNCDVKFDTDYQIKVHMGKVHSVEKYRIKCEHCPKVCTTKGAMLLHVQSLHSNARYECDLCEYKTGIKWLIKLHKRKHDGDKSYACSECERRFGRSSNLRAHMKVHTGHYGRVCRWCRRGFVDTDSLNEHEKQSHYYDRYK